MVAVLGLVAFALLGRVFRRDVFAEGWFYVGLGMAVSAVFIEPFFASAQDAIVNGAGGLAAFVALPHKPVLLLWWSFFALAVALVATGAFAVIAPEGRAKFAMFRLASRFGRAVVVGTSLLLLVALRAAAAGVHDFQYFVIGSALLVASVAVDWLRLIRRVAGRIETATVVAAIGPRMLLVAGPSHDLSPGEVVELGSGDATTLASVVARLPHGTGLRYQLALQGEWTSVCDGFPSEIVMAGRGDDDALVGAVGHGTTARRLEFEPFRPIDIGQPLALTSRGRTALYQVVGLELTNSDWAGSRAVTPRATARLVGWPDDCQIRGGAYLPPPHDLIRTADGMEGGLNTGFHEVGCVKSTAIKIGLRIDDERRGHIAILGMSGMGKTAAAQRLASALGRQLPVIALDTTGEYRSRSGVPAWTPDDFDTAGFFVYEPAGDPPTKAAQFITQCMTAGSTEYRAGKTPLGRVVVLEEAHVFVPEWNFGQRGQQDQVSASSRMIMQARKFGLTFIIVSQRTAVVTKSALSQCENYIVLKTIDQTSLEYLETMVGREYIEAIAELKQHEALCVGPSFNCEEPAIVTLTPP
jgi:hypothetical protein